MTKYNVEITIRDQNIIHTVNDVVKVDEDTDGWFLTIYTENGDVYKFQKTRIDSIIMIKII